MNVIKAIDVQKSYSGISAVDGVSLSIKKGEIFALIGPNGAGKTTLINCLTGAAPFDSGSIQILNNTPRNVEKSKISLLPQSFEPPTHLTVSELIIYFSGLYGIKNDPHHILEKVGLSSQSNKKFYELSGGQKRRICVGISIINDPEILFSCHTRRVLQEEMNHVSLKFLMWVYLVYTFVMIYGFLRVVEH